MNNCIDIFVVAKHQFPITHEDAFTKEDIKFTYIQLLKQDKTNLNLCDVSANFEDDSIRFDWSDVVRDRTLSASQTCSLQPIL